MSIPFVYVHACWKYSSRRWRNGLGIWEKNNENRVVYSALELNLFRKKPISSQFYESFDGLNINMFTQEIKLPDEIW